MFDQVPRWHACAFAALAVLAGAYAASLRSSNSTVPASGDDNVAVLHARLARSESERRRLEEALQICQLNRAEDGAHAPIPHPTSWNAGPSAPSLPSFAPEHRQSILRQRYGEILHELALSAEQSDALLATLATLDPSAGMLPTTPPDPAREHVALAQVIGADQATEFQRQKLTLPARAEVRAVRDRLEAAGDELTQEQYEQLRATLKESALALEPPTPTSSADETPAQRVARFNARIDERERVFREAESSVLTASQLRLLDAGRAPMRMLSGSAVNGRAGSPG